MPVLSLKIECHCYSKIIIRQQATKYKDNEVKRRIIAILSLFLSTRCQAYFNFVSNALQLPAGRIFNVKLQGNYQGQYFNI